MTLLERQKHTALEYLNKELPAPGSTSFTRQQEPLGLGHAVWCARELVGREPFALLLPDVLVQHPRGCLAQMMDAARGADRSRQYRRGRGSPRRAHRSIRRGRRWRTHRQDVRHHQHGGEAAARPRASNLILTGRYILQPEILDLLGTQERGTGGEIQLTDAMIQLARTQAFYGLEFEGRSFDCGSKIGFLAANVSYALSRKDIAPGFRTEIIKNLRRDQRRLTFSKKTHLVRRDIVTLERPNSRMGRRRLWLVKDLRDDVRR